MNRAACRKEPKKILRAAAEGKGSQVNCFFGVPYADSIASPHHSLCPLLRWWRWMGDAQSQYWNLYEK